MRKLLKTWVIVGSKTLMLRCSFAVLLLMGFPAAADQVTFETPSENIQCIFGHDKDVSGISCTIIARTGPIALPRPIECPSEQWGHTFFMERQGRVEGVCDPLPADLDGERRAAYGRSEVFDGIICSSAVTGLTCTNMDGHGFFLSRRQQRVF